MDQIESVILDLENFSKTHKFSENDRNEIDQNLDDAIRNIYHFDGETLKKLLPVILIVLLKRLNSGQKHASDLSEQLIYFLAIKPDDYDSTEAEGLPLKEKIFDEFTSAQSKLITLVLSLLLNKFKIPFCESETEMAMLQWADRVDDPTFLEKVTKSVASKEPLMLKK